jgi:hypothetical protein
MKSMPQKVFSTFFPSKINGKQVVEERTMMEVGVHVNLAGQRAARNLDTPFFCFNKLLLAILTTLRNVELNYSERRASS